MFGYNIMHTLAAGTRSKTATVPSIYTSMKKPQSFEEMVNLRFAVVMFTCLAVAISGYYIHVWRYQVTLSLEAAFSKKAAWLKY